MATASNFPGIILANGRAVAGGPTMAGFLCHTTLQRDAPNFQDTRA
jgi:hypothetical protein